jgi:glycosyltransferase involved in cell wall biosynthesis
MDKHPLVSIVIPNFNYGHFLAEAIESALGQSYPGKEVIVVDDGSTDSSTAVIASFAGRIRHVAKENGGLSSARNAGLGVARGDLLLFLDADDILAPGAVERLVSAHAARGGGDRLVYGDSLFFDGCAEWPVKRKAPSGRIWRALLGGNFICCHEALVPRRLALKEAGFDECLRMSEDFDLWLRLARNHPFLHVPVLVARRRIHANMMSQQADELQFWAGQALEKQWRRPQGWRERAAIAGGLGRNFHLRAWLAKERGDPRAMRDLSLSSIRWQPWRAKNWLYLGAAWLAGWKRASRGEYRP